VGVGIFAQFIALPAMSFLLTVLFRVPADIALGLILIGCCPGGNFSNLMTFIARGNTALSISMTAISSSLSVIALPANFLFYASLRPETSDLVTSIEVGARGIVFYVIFVVFIPLLLGLWARKLKPALAVRSEVLFRRLSLVLLLSFVAFALAANWTEFVDRLTGFVALVCVHNGLALALGFGLAFLCRLSPADRKAVTLETGIQNSGLGLGIILSFYSELSGMVIIAAAWSIWHLISGLLLSGHWARQHVSLEMV
jgi:BASS family bile acid:Na+ symporter